MTSTEAFYLHPLLRYNQHIVASGHCCPLIWDLRDPPESARRVVSTDQTIPLFYLSLPATYPPIAILHITSDLLPGQWPIEVRRLEGITIGDVLSAIHAALMLPIHRKDWDSFSEKHRGRIDLVFDKRCENAAADREKCRARGVLRMDCLLQHTLFAGLSISLVKDCSCILTLRRPPRAMASMILGT